MFISGATGDAGHWNEVADALADEYTILTYDRRANSRSPRPENWGLSCRFRDRAFVSVSGVSL